MLPNSGMVFTRSIPVATPVDRCVCHNKTFAELAALAKAENLDHAALSARTGCSTNCGTCAPYIRLMLKGGWTRFPVLSQADFVRLLGPDGAKKGV
jgi:bacterioferritin-associated ferredoxin